MSEAAWEHLKRYGYAPGNYMNMCHTCGKVVEFVDKRAITCRPCAEARHAAPSPVAQAPAQAAEVVEAIRVLWEEIGTYSVQCTKTGELAPCRSLVDAVDALAALATQPLAAPVQQEAEAVAWQMRIKMSDGEWRRWEECSDCSESDPQEVVNGPMTMQFRPLYATPPAHPVFAPVVREPLTEAQALAANPYINDPARQALWLAAIRFAERFHGIQATTGEPS